MARTAGAYNARPGVSAGGVRTRRSNPSRAPEAPQALRAFTLVMLFVGVHTGLSISEGTTLLAPYALAFAAALLAIAQDYRRLTHRMVVAAASLAAVVVAHTVICSVLYPGYTTDRFRSTIQMLYVGFIGIAWFLCITGLTRPRAERLFIIILLVLLAGTALENAGVLRNVSDTFREVMNPWRPVYAQDQRDILVYGGVRPKLFSQEPSILGLSVSLCTVLWFVTGDVRAPMRIMFSLLLTVIAFVLIRSATILYAVACCGVALCAFGWRGASIRRIATTIILIGTVGFSAILPNILYDYNRRTHSSVRYVSTASFFIRQVAPALVARDVLKEQPLLGAGIGADAPLLNTVRAVFGRNSGGYRLEHFVVDETNHALTNVFWEFIIYLGLAGAVALIIAISVTLTSLGSPVAPVLAMWLLIVQTFGGINHVLTWTCLFALAAACWWHRDLKPRPGRSPIAGRPSTAA